MIKFNRVWSMPNKNTFSIKPIKELLSRYVDKEDKLWIDPFANSSKVASVTNDLDELFDTDYHLDVLDFMKLFKNDSVNGVLIDSPYSPRQLSECYKKLNLSVTMETTQSSFWSKIKDEVARVVKSGGLAITFGWNSNGIGKTRGFEIIEILLVAHGGNHNDTIVTVEKKLN